MFADLIKTILLGIVEGVTEFLPVSSTGHLFLCEKWMGIDFKKDPFWGMFAIFIQIGAILAVVVYFWPRIITLLQNKRAGVKVNLMDAAAVRPVAGAGDGALAGPLATEMGDGIPASRQPRLSPLLLVLIATVPVLIVGKLTHNYVEEHLEAARPIALALGIGGIIMIALELLRPPTITRSVEEMSPLQAIWVGLVQILSAVFPGTSRSAATIIGGMAGGMSRQAAAEFSFFLAIPAMAAATMYSLLKHIKEHGGLPMERIMLLVIGTLVSFLVAWAVIAAFMAYIRKRSFIPFAIYRIVLAAIVLWAAR